MPEHLKGYGPADLARMRSVTVRPTGWTNATRDQVRERRDRHGRPVKVTLDQLGNLVRERWEGQDVQIFLPHIRVRHTTEVQR